jgi:wyosine [tRNA(Phe)-imidazoG37] synthetase (radical SAM superfamily)
MPRHCPGLVGTKLRKGSARRLRPRATRKMNTLLSDHSRQFEQLRFAYPVVSRRSRGLSLGLNVNPDKVCNFDCPYCQVDRTVPPRDREVDFDAMLAELDALLRSAVSGEIWRHPRFAATPEPMRRLNDVAFAGEGEPTTWPRLGEAIRAVQDLKVKHGARDVPTIVLTNALLLGRADVLDALEGLKLGPYEIWAKLDAGTQGFFELMAGRRLRLRTVLDAILACARRFEVTIQTLLPTVDGRDPGDTEADAIAGHVQDIADAGGDIRLIQLYTTARRPAESRIGMIEDQRLDELAEVMRARTRVPVKVYYGRHWD